MLYAFPDEAGKIGQANKIFAPTEAYERQLRERGLIFVTHPTATILPPEDYWVSSGAIVERPVLAVLALRTKIKAGGADKGVLVGVPKAAVVTLTTGGTLLYRGQPGATELEIPIPVPCVYRVAIDLWPYKTFVAEIEAFA